MSDILIHTFPNDKRFIDLTGEKFGRLTILSYAGKRKRSRLWHCVCDCGNSKTVRSGNMKSGCAKSCGCILSEINISTKTTHGLTKSPMYKTWSWMIQRCKNKDASSYKNYGGRGITVCERWSNSFENFIEDMGPKPTPRHSIDRIDNDGDYTSSNCKWSTKVEQNRNQRMFKNNQTGIKGVSQSPSGIYRACIGLGYKNIHIGTFGTLDEAVAARKDAELKYWS